MGNMQLKNLKGFTLVELIAVVAIISMIAVYITISINESSDDAKVGIATAFLASNVPAAISGFKARNMSSCRNMSDTTFNPTAPTVTALLTARGLSPNSPWDDLWTASYDDTARQISLVFTVSGANSVQSAAEITANLNSADVPQVVGATAASNVVTIIYDCA